MMEQEKNLQLWRNLRSQWKRKGRKHKQLVILRLGSMHVEASCWQQDCCLWQKEKALTSAWQESDAGHAGWWQELERVLQDIFIWARVPDMVDTLVLLHEELVFSEQLELPLLKEKQLLMAIAWEAEQLVPWEQGSYNTAFAAAAMAEDKLQVQLWAWSKEQAQLAQHMTLGLHLRLQGIFVGMSSARLQQAWYQGYSLQNWSLLGDSGRWQQQAEHYVSSTYAKRLGKACVTMSIALYLVAQGGCYLAARGLEATNEELLQYAHWQQRLEQSQRLDEALARYGQLDKRLQENTSRMASNIARLGQRLSTSCWLELLRGDSKSKAWQLEGSCYEPEALQRLLENLEQDPRLTQVRLLSSQQQRHKLSFSIAVKEK